MSLQMVARGQTIDVLDSLGLPHPTTAKSMRYWLDDDDVSVTTVSSLDGSYAIDAASLLDGLHTIHYQIVDSENKVGPTYSGIFLKIAESASASKAATLRYWYDDETNVMTCSANVGVQQLDVSGLLDGLHTLHYQVVDADGHVSYIASSIFLKMNGTGPSEKVTASKLIYWFDDQQETTTIETTDAVQVLDASGLLNGLHTIHYMVVCSDGSITSAYSSIFLRMNVDTEATIASRMRYWFDDEAAFTEVEVTTGTMTLDASHLLDGLHTVHYQLIDQNGASATPMSSIFLRMTEGTATTAQNLRYWFDDDTDVKTTSVAGGNQTLDVSGLLTGLHTLHYQLVDSNGNVCAPMSGIFFKQFDKVVESSENVITQYMYWMNDNSADNHKVKIANPSSPYQLITLLQTIKAPIRTSSFHFEVKDGVPMIYAKNDLHVRFEDAAGYWVDDSRSFVDYSVSETITDASELQSTQTFARPDINQIKWFEFEAAPGDTIAFKASQATSLQVFAPSGKEIYSASGDKSVQYGGAHTWEDGTYYVAVHDVTGSKPSVTLDYMHMDKYDVVSQDVHVVGNGGCSTITFQGNGFKDLYAVDLKDSNGNIIESIDVGHESDATTTVTFDFTGAKLGIYNAVFHFTEDDKTVTNCITVEEAKEIELATKVSFPSTFLRGTAVTYKVEISNLSNMTAYMVPLEMKLIVDNIKNVQSVQFDGFLKSLVMPNSYDFEDLEPEDIEDIRQIISNSNDLSQFIIYHDSINGKDYGLSQVIMTLPPYSTQTFSVSIKSTSNVHFEAWTTNDWFPVAYKEASARRAKSMKAPSRESMCCMKDKFECGAEIVANIAGAFMPPGAGCLSSLSLTGLETAYDVWCSEGNSASERWNNYLKSEGNSLASRLIQSAVTCITGFYGARLKALREDRVMAAKLGSTSEVERINAEIAACRTAQNSAVRSIYDGITTMILGGSCYKAFTETKPNCPPNPGGGGGHSSPVNSYDPNDIYGYIAPSGSMYVGDEVLTLPYRIEFENDTTFATSAAHTVVVKDTLDAKVFDLASYQPTSIKIGDKSVQLKGDKTFVTTVDMRPAINAIAQVEGKYDEKKGIATWLFTSLDPMTMEPTDDIMQGFLPVNYDGSGIGEVAYNINRKAGLPDGTAISNKASIIFDSNDAIMTPVWTNTIDAVPPTSHVSGLEMLTNDSVRIHFEGTDERSGVWKYTLYAQYGEGTSWEKVAEVDTTCADFKFYADIDYGFCVLATDSAGNVEQKEFVREYALQSYLSGDVDDDGILTMADVKQLTLYVLGVTPLPRDIRRLDVNGDRYVTMADVVCLLRVLNNSAKTKVQRGS